jgi:peptidoglycan/LPS O-acetylase OafA/YrhL
MTWQAILIPLLVAGTVLRPERAAARVLESAPARWVGRMSYSLYLWQQLFLVGERAALVPPMSWAQALPLNLAMTVVVAAASYYLIEKPAIRVGHRLAARWDGSRGRETPAARVVAGPALRWRHGD